MPLRSGTRSIYIKSLNFLLIRLHTRIEGEKRRKKKKRRLNKTDERRRISFFRFFSARSCENNCLKSNLGDDKEGKEEGEEGDAEARRANGLSERFSISISIFVV